MTASSISENDRPDDVEATTEDQATPESGTGDDTKLEADDAQEAADQTEAPEPIAEADESHQGSGFASAALRLLIIILVVFGLALWLVPMLTPHLPASVAKHIMPGQQMLDERLAAFETDLTGKVDTASSDVVAMREQVAALTERLAAAEAEAAAAKADAEAARTAAEQSAEVATTSSASEAIATEAKEAAGSAAEAAQTATTVAQDANKVAETATRETAALTEKLGSVETRLNALTNELGALGESLATTGGEGGGTASGLSAAFAALKARVDGLGAQLDGAPDYVTREEANGFVTQNDLRSARTALVTDLQTGLERLPDPATIITTPDLDSFRTAVDGRLTDLATRLETAEQGATSASEAATAAAEASTAAVGEVQVAIRQASLRAAVAALTSRLGTGQAYQASLDEIAGISGTAPPEALAGAAASGVATAESLLQSFGGAAQAGLAADIKANAEGDGVLGQAGAQLLSVVAGRPKGELEGDGADAVISRIEARLKDGALSEALAEAEALSDAAKAAMDGWLGQLRTRVAVDAAASEYLQDLEVSQG